MEKHKELLNSKFNHSSDDLLYNPGGNVMWSLFRFDGGSLAIYYHDTDSFHILNSSNAKWHELDKIADNWNPVNNE